MQQMLLSFHKFTNLHHTENDSFGWEGRNSMPHSPKVFLMKTKNNFYCVCWRLGTRWTKQKIKQKSFFILLIAKRDRKIETFAVQSWRFKICLSVSEESFKEALWLPQGKQCRKFLV